MALDAPINDKVKTNFDLLCDVQGSNLMLLRVIKLLLTVKDDSIIMR
jgi:hypothetical protein